MHAIDALLAGVRGAENGTAQLYVRGSSQPARYWMDFEASQQIAAGTDIDLDSNGGATVYVNQLVDVKVLDANGNTVREFTAGSNATAIEALTQSFTGTDHTTGLQAAGNPTTLQAILDLWKTNAGASDWKVRVGSSNVTLPSALASTYGLYYNVKDTAYGAHGDGVADDTTAVQAAITAASAAGGGTVLFPPGTYRVTGGLTLPYTVNLAGTSNAQSIILLDAAIADGFTYTSGAFAAKSIIRDLCFKINQDHSGSMVVADILQLNVDITNCVFDTNGHVGTTAISAPTSTPRISVYYCKFQSYSIAIGMQGGGTLTFLFNVCLLKTGSLAITYVNCYGQGIVCGNTFDASNVSSGSFVYLNFNQSGVGTSNGAPAAVVANGFLAPGGTATGSVTLNKCIEVANRRSSSAILMTVTGATAASSFSDYYAESVERTIRTFSTGNDTVIPDGAGEIVFEDTDGGAALTFPTWALGRRVRMWLISRNVGGSNFTFVAAGITITANVTLSPLVVAQNKARYVEFEAINTVTAGQCWLGNIAAGDTTGTV